MPKRSPVGNRSAIEAELSLEELAGLRATCASCGIPPLAWQRIAALEMTYSTAAAARLAARLEREERLSTKTAVLEAATRLGLNPDTVRSRLERWPRDARRVA